ncbi:hypothetical protein Tco_0947498 [Tanacetum coccineum]
MRHKYVLLKGEFTAKKAEASFGRFIDQDASIIAFPLSEGNLPTVYGKEVTSNCSEGDASIEAVTAARALGCTDQIMEITSPKSLDYQIRNPDEKMRIQSSQIVIESDVLLCTRFEYEKRKICSWTDMEVQWGAYTSKILVRRLENDVDEGIDKSSKGYVHAPLEVKGFITTASLSFYCLNSLFLLCVMEG